MHLSLSLLRVVDLAMTKNMAMQLSRQDSHEIISRRLHNALWRPDFFVKRSSLGLPCDEHDGGGPGNFMHADANSSAVFHSLRIAMLFFSLMYDGATANMSEITLIWTKTGVSSACAPLLSLP
jgi:hypothetical protein